jgi:hypothetical protein
MIISFIRGIMVPTFRAKELVHVQKGLLLFTPQQAERMRDRAREQQHR